MNLDKIKRHQKEIERVWRAYEVVTAPDEALTNYTRTQMAEQRAATVDAILAMNLASKPIDYMVEKMCQMAEQVKRSRKDLEQCERRAGMNHDELKQLFKHVRMSEEEEFALCRKLGLHPSELYEIEARTKLAAKRIFQIETGLNRF